MTSFIIIDDSSEISPNEAQNYVTYSPNDVFAKTNANGEPAIIIIDSTEDESDESIIKLQRKYIKIKKNKVNIKKIKLAKRRNLFKSAIFERNQVSSTADNTSIKEMDSLHAILPLSVEKDIKVGCKYQANIPKFEFLTNTSDFIKKLQNQMVWKPKTVSDEEFKECKSIIQTILQLNYFTDDFVCQFLALNHYSVEETINYCLINKNKLQGEIIDSFIPNDPLFRKTRNSMYNKFLMKKL